MPAPKSDSVGSFDFWANGTNLKGQLISAKAQEIAMYVDVASGYPCPYYLDRADLVAPELNRVAQFMRSFGSKIIFQTGKVAPSKVKVNRDIPVVTDNHLDETSPLLEDRCLFDDYNKDPAPVDTAIHHAFMYSSQEDYFVNERENAIRLALDAGAKYLIVCGMNCNQWLPAFFEQARSVGLQPLYLYDISDVTYFRATQGKKLETHVAAIEHFYHWLIKQGYLIVNHFMLIDRHPIGKSPYEYHFDGNMQAHYFRDYFEPMY